MIWWKFAELPVSCSLIFTHPDVYDGVCCLRDDVISVAIDSFHHGAPWRRLLELLAGAFAPSQWLTSQIDTARGAHTHTALYCYYYWPLTPLLCAVHANGADSAADLFTFWHAARIAGVCEIHWWPGELNSFIKKGNDTDCTSWSHDGNTNSI